MENTKIMALPQQVENNDDCFIRLCDSHEQRLRRKQRMQADCRKQTVTLAVKYLMASMVGAACATGVLSLIWRCMV